MPKPSSTNPNNAIGKLAARNTASSAKPQSVSVQELNVKMTLLAVQ